MSKLDRLKAAVEQEARDGLKPPGIYDLARPAPGLYPEPEPEPEPAEKPLVEPESKEEARPFGEPKLGSTEPWTPKELAYLEMPADELELLMLDGEDVPERIAARVYGRIRTAGEEIFYLFHG